MRHVEEGVEPALIRLICLPLREIVKVRVEPDFAEAAITRSLFQSL